MAIKNVTITLNGSTYELDLDSSTGKYKNTISAPAVTSWGQDNHVYGMVLKVTDTAGNVTTVDKNNATYGAQMQLRVKEKVEPTIAVSSPSDGAYLTNNTVTFSIDITDAGSGVAGDTISAKLDKTELTLTKSTITNGYRCTYSGNVEDGIHTITVNASDNDGNAATTKTVTFTVDTVAPMLNISAPSANLITNVQACTVSGTTTDATSGLASVVVTLNGTAQGTVTVASDGTFSKVVSLAKGSNTIKITATDKAGKTTTVTRTVVYDPDAPVILSIDIVPNPVNTGDEITITVQATD